MTAKRKIKCHDVSHFMLLTDLVARTNQAITAVEYCLNVTRGVPATSTLMTVCKVLTSSSWSQHTLRFWACGCKPIGPRQTSRELKKFKWLVERCMEGLRGKIGRECFAKKIDSSTGSTIGLFLSDGSNALIKPKKNWSVIMLLSPCFESTVCNNAAATNCEVWIQCDQAL